MMGDNIVLRFQFAGQDTDVVVSDLDKVNLIDIVMVYLDNAEKQKNKIPKYPGFSYVFKMKHIQLTTDITILKMFEDLKGISMIYIWVSDLTKPTKVFEAAMRLRHSQSSNQSQPNSSPLPETETQPTMLNETEPTPTHVLEQQFVSPRRSPRLMPDVIHVEPITPVHGHVLSQPTQSQVINPTQAAEPESPLNIGNLILENMEYWNNLNVEPFERNNGRGRGGGRLRGKGRGRGRGRAYEKGKHPVELDYIPETQPTQPIIVRRSPRHGKSLPESSCAAAKVIQIPQMLHSSVEPAEDDEFLKKTSPFIKKRVPKTTAKRKGLGKTSNAVAANLNQVLQSTTHEQLDLDVDDEDFFPSETDDSHTLTVSLVDENMDDDSDVGDENSNDQDNGNGDLLLPMINDAFDPYDESVWENDCEDKDNYLLRLYNNGEFYTADESGDIQLKAWQIYTDKYHLRDTVRDHCVQKGFAIVVEAANNRSYTVRCSDVTCQWRLHASKLVDGVTWAIKSIQNSEHTCLGLETNNSMVTAKWAARILKEDIAANNDIPGKALNELLWARFGIQMKLSTLYRAKTLALNELHGGHDISYSFLPNYCEVIRGTNPDSVAHCCWNPTTHPTASLGFSSLFICFKGCLDGVVAGCRGLIGIDGAFLKGNFRGVLLSAVALDGNNEIFPLAWGIVSSEDDESWRFFIWHLRNTLTKTSRGNKWCIISDRHKSIDKAFKDLWPDVDRRYCAKHLSANFKKAHPDPKMFQLFWLAAGATSPYTFRKAMQQIQQVQPGALVWLADVGDQSLWTKHQFDPDIKCEVNKTNFVESFNATLGVSRCRPVVTLLEGIRRVTMVRLATRRQNCENWDRTDLCPNIVKRVQKLCVDSRACMAYPSGPGEFEVIDGKSTLPVSLKNWTCVCNLWQLSGIPCKHGMRAILMAGMDPHKFVHEAYSVKRYKLAYGSTIKSIPDFEQWPETDLPRIQPPIMKRRVGRPTRNRRRAEDEEQKGKRSKTVKCSKCKTFGHNATTCAGGETKKQSEQRKGSTSGTKKDTKRKGKTDTESTTAAKKDNKRKGKNVTESATAAKKRKT